MKIFVAKNDKSQSDFVESNTMFANHSCGYVIVAESLEEAEKLVERDDVLLKEVILDKQGVILYASGEC